MRTIKLSFFLFFFIIIPSFASYSLFYYNVDIPVKNEKIGDDKILVTVDKNVFLKPNLKYTLRRIFQAPFDLSYYNICILNDSKAAEQSEVEFLDTTITLDDIETDKHSIDSLTIKGGGRECFVTNLESMFLSAGGFTYSLKYFPSLVEFDINIHAEEKAYPNIYDKIASTIIFFVAWLSMMMLIISILKMLIGICKKRKNNMNEEVV